MGIEQRRAAPGEKFVCPEISQAVVFGEVLVTRFPELDIKTCFAQNESDIDRLVQKLKAVGTTWGLREPIQAPTGAAILISAPSQVETFTFENPHKESPDSDAIYLAKYQTGQHLFLLQWLNGATSRHHHPDSLEAFSVLKGDYYVNDETLGSVRKLNSIETTRATVHSPHTDHQCFTLRSPALVAIVMSGQSFDHQHIEPRMNLNYLREKALALENGHSPGL